jgi:hypothetical protein
MLLRIRTSRNLQAAAVAGGRQQWAWRMSANVSGSRRFRPGRHLRPARKSTREICPLIRMLSCPARLPRSRSSRFPGGTIRSRIFPQYRARGAPATHHRIDHRLPGDVRGQVTFCTEQTARVPESPNLAGLQHLVRLRTGQTFGLFHQMQHRQMVSPTLRR